MHGDAVVAFVLQSSRREPFMLRDGDLTVAGLRGSRAAQLIERCGAANQVADHVRHLFFTGCLAD